MKHVTRWIRLALNILDDAALGLSSKFKEIG